MLFIELYQNYIVWVLYIILIAILVEIFFLKKKYITGLFKTIKKKTWAYLFIIFLVGFIVRIFVFPHFHLLYIDEPWNLEIAKNIDNKNQPVICRYAHPDSEACFLSKKPPGWPFLVSILYKIFEPSNFIAFYFNSVLGSLSIILIFAFSYLLFNNEKIGLWTSFFLSLMPIHILWSNSAEANNASVFFVLLSVIFFIIYVKSREKSILSLTALLLIFTAIVRFENIILITVLFFAYVKLSKTIPKNSLWEKLNLYYQIILIIIFILIIIVEIYFISFFRPAILDRTMDFYYLNLLPLLNSSSFNYLYLFLAVLGITFFNKKFKNEIIFLITSFLIFYLIYLPVFSESRMALTPSLFLIVLSAYSLEELCSKTSRTIIARFFAFFILLIIFLLSLNLSYERVYGENNNRILETQSAIQIKNDALENCIIIAEFPSVLTSISNMKGISTIDVLKNPEIVDKAIVEGSCVYYFHDGYCIEDTISTPQGSKLRCQEMLKTFDYKQENKFEKADIEYFLFRINGISG